MNKLIISIIILVSIVIVLICGYLSSNIDARRKSLLKFIYNNEIVIDVYDNMEQHTFEYFKTDKGTNEINEFSFKINDTIYKEYGDSILYVKNGVNSRKINLFEFYGYN